ncbi:MAG: hypothetical protein BV456_03590 [Thermoplasmata archaeon M8B2D]|nr:MAG: hypothetical protein BV456_03590 [Thermoplasmata archaeon M8B2D]
MNRHELLSYIYTELWKYYKQFINDKNILYYENNCISLLKEIKIHNDQTVYNFAENQIINFTPIINELKTNTNQ